LSVANDNIIPGDPVSLAIDWTSEPVYIYQIVVLSIQLVFNGSPNGVFSLECSNDEYSSSQSPQNWTLITGSEQSVNEDGNHTWNIEDAGFRWVRVNWVSASGTGTLQVARYNGKGV
jgi:hypothetical protein